MSGRKRVLFVTGTDTGVGKTLIASALLRGLRERGARVAGMKPIASGGRETSNGIVNDDALALIAEASEPAPYRIVNPYSFVPAIAPHVAAVEAGTRIDLRELERAFRILAGLADVVVIEGAGGWLVPLDERHALADFAKRVKADVILVVGLRLGCLNHALLTAAAVAHSGLKLAGWVGNGIDPGFERSSDNVRALEERLRAPLLGVVPHRSPADAATALECLDLDALQ
ncbi:MAG TPA: dethiobiotin synthase [Steroidobacteraceae bacterium]|nr:dethiobiotin synthase [Steroidobacteraceae bacterium]